MARNSIAVANSIFFSDKQHLAVTPRERNIMFDMPPFEAGHRSLAGPPDRVGAGQFEAYINLGPGVRVIMHEDVVIAGALHTLIVSQSEMVETHRLYALGKRGMELRQIIHIRNLGDQITNKRHSHSVCNSTGSA